MEKPNDREFRVEWRMGGVMSLIVSANSNADAIEKAKSVPREQDGWSVEGITDLILAFPAERPPARTAPVREDPRAEDGVERSYCVSYEFCQTCCQTVFAVDSEVACQNVSRDSPKWEVQEDWQNWRARPVRA